MGDASGRPFLPVERRNSPLQDAETRVDVVEEVNLGGHRMV